MLQLRPLTRVASGFNQRSAPNTHQCQFVYQQAVTRTKRLCTWVDPRKKAASRISIEVSWFSQNRFTFADFGIVRTHCKLWPQTPRAICRAGPRVPSGVSSGVMTWRLFQIWTHDVPEATRTTVFPDGCRDVLIIRQPGARPQVRLTRFDLRPRTAALMAGSALQGFRLRPGAGLSAQSLEAIAAAPDRAEAVIRSDLVLSEDADYAIRALGLPEATVTGTARDLGLSLRSLQRLFRALDLPPPDYWRLLSRARRAAAQLAAPVPLAAIAADCGFSDQAHLTRETLRWFGQTPRQIRHDAARLALLGQPALGNWSEGI